MKHMEFLDLNQQIKWKLQQSFVNKADQMRKKKSQVLKTQLRYYYIQTVIKEM